MFNNIVHYHNISGIYKIINCVDSKCYIGQSTNLRKRKVSHFSELKRNKHYNTHLQNAYNLYGAENFKFEIIVICEPFELTRYEQFFVDNQNKDSMYNFRTLCVVSPLGTKASSELRTKLSMLRTGKKINRTAITSDETKEKIKQGLKNYYAKHDSSNKGILRKENSKLKQSTTLLSSEKILKIINKLNDGFSVYDVVIDLKTDYDTIYKIADGYYDKRDNITYSSKLIKQYKREDRKSKYEQIYFLLCNSGLMQKDIAEMLGCSKAIVANVKHGLYYSKFGIPGVNDKDRALIKGERKANDES